MFGLLCTTLTSLSIKEVYGQTFDDYIIEDNTVYIDNEYIYLGVTPKTSCGGWVYLNFTSKVLSGDLDLIFGFDNEIYKPKRLEVYDPRIVETVHNKTIPKEYNNDILYTNDNISCKFFYQVYNAEGIGDDYYVNGELRFYQYFYNDKEEIISGGLADIVYFDIFDNREGKHWYIYTTEKVKGWSNIGNKVDFRFTKLKYKDMNSWYTITFNAKKDFNYNLKFWLDIIPSGEKVIGKYFVGIKRSQDTFLEALQYKRFFVLDPWLSDSWEYRTEITIDHNKIDSDLVDFPLYVFLNSSNINFTNVKDDLGDIRFTEQFDIELLYADLDEYETNINASIHVKVPLISSSVDTKIYMYYSNPDASAYWSSEDVYDNNYVIVNHMKDTGGTSVDDSTQYGLDGVKKSNNEPLESEGKIAHGEKFDGSDDYITLPSTVSILNLETQATISFLLNINSSNTYQHIVGLRDNFFTGDYYVLYISSIKKFECRYVCSNGITNIYSGDLTNYLGTWLHFAFVRDGVNVRTYINGNLDISITDGKSGVWGWCAHNMYFGRFPPDPQHFLNSTLDEVRITVGSYRTGEWIKAEYYSLMNLLVTYGEETMYKVIIGEFETDTIVYPYKPTFYNFTISDTAGYNYINNITLELSGNIKILFDENTKTFSEILDSNNYFELLPNSTYTIINSTSIKISVMGILLDIYPEGYKNGYVAVYNDVDSLFSNSENNWFLFSSIYKAGIGLPITLGVDDNLLYIIIGILIIILSIIGLEKPITALIGLFMAIGVFVYMIISQTEQTMILFGIICIIASILMFILGIFNKQGELA